MRVAEAARQLEAAAQAARAAAGAEDGGRAGCRFRLGFESSRGTQMRWRRGGGWQLD